ncbi:MAG TPA: cyclic nucleotide-binding domain-containing protein [Blastocatellia bacterium]|nr:cyclic nucleotide-binding domain-containing protein [Blastocatellia bacterium]
MSREHKSRREVVNALKSIPSMSDLLSMHEGHFEYELDLEVIVYGRNYNGKKVGPYVRLLTFEPSETIITEGEWGGNTFYVAVDGRLDVFVNANGGSGVKVAELPAGTQFGEMSVLAGVPRNATVKSPPDRAVKVLEVQRPALRLLRKIPNFGETLDKTYRSHGKTSLIGELKSKAGLNDEMGLQLSTISQFRVLSKGHVLFSERGRVDRLYIVQSGWMSRSSLASVVGQAQVPEDFLGDGFCFGLEGVMRDAVWPYTATLMGRTEVLEISVNKLRQNVALREAVTRGLAAFAPPATIGEKVNFQPVVREKILSAQQRLINTGLVDANNLLVMDMELCVRCGNCSLACHKIHGQSRLTRHGIHVTRLTKPKKSADQSILSPAVCMHCKDPECLTGCPTGAIGRFGGGQIDINPQTCIGCGDCASQCPYDAISMVSRKKEAPKPNGNFASKLRDLFRLTPDPLPQPVEQTDELMAVKCNLCAGTGMNPEGSKRVAYGCEESCPTGALARINPREYFTEVGEIEGLVFRDQSHAIGRNIHRSDPPRRLIHIAGVLMTLLLTAAGAYGIAHYGLGARLAGFLNMRWITGLVGLAGIALVMTYPVRRQIFRKRAGALRYWMLAHSYIGVIAGVMILLHGGTDSGGAFTSILMISFDLVILTGLFGILCYLTVPRVMTRIEGEPLLIEDLLKRREELQNEIAEAANSPSEPLRNLVKNKVVPHFLSFGNLLKQFLKRASLDDMIESAKLEFHQQAAGLPGESDRQKFMRAVEAAATLRRVDALIFLHRLLKAWLVPHVIFTSLMLALMVVHIIQVIYFA